MIAEGTKASSRTIAGIYLESPEGEDAERGDVGCVQEYEHTLWSRKGRCGKAGAMAGWMSSCAFAFSTAAKARPPDPDMEGYDAASSWSAPGSNSVCLAQARKGTSEISEIHPRQWQERRGASIGKRESLSPVEQLGGSLQAGVPTRADIREERASCGEWIQLCWTFIIKMQDIPSTSVLRVIDSHTGGEPTVSSLKGMATISLCSHP